MFALLCCCSGCGVAETTASSYAGEDSWTTITPSKVQARVSKFTTRPDGKLTGTIEYALPALPNNVQTTWRVIASTPVAEGAKTPIAIDGHPCEVEQLHLQVTEDSVIAPGQKYTRSQSQTRTRTSRGIGLKVQCLDGSAVPGTSGSERGANPRRAYPPAMAGLLPGLAVGVLIEKDRIMTALLAILGTGVAAILLGWQGYGGLFGIVLGLVFVGYAIIGGIAGTSSTRMNRVAPGLVLSGGALAGAIPVLFAYSSWQYGGPLIAFGATVLAAVVGGVIWAMASKD